MPKWAKEEEMVTDGAKSFLAKFWDEMLGGLILYKTGQAATGGGQGRVDGNWLSDFLLAIFPSMTDEDERLWAEVTSMKSVAEQQLILLFVENLKSEGFDESVFILRIIKIYKGWKEKNLQQQQYNVADKILSDIISLDQQGFDVQRDFCLGKKLLVKKGVFKKAFQWSRKNKFVLACYLATGIFLFLYFFSVVFE